MCVRKRACVCLVGVVGSGTCAACILSIRSSSEFLKCADTDVLSEAFFFPPFVVDRRRLGSSNPAPYVPVRVSDVRNSWLRKSLSVARNSLTTSEDSVSRFVSRKCAASYLTCGRVVVACAVALEVVDAVAVALLQVVVARAVALALEVEAAVALALLLVAVTCVVFVMNVCSILSRWHSDASQLDFCVQLN